MNDLSSHFASRVLDIRLICKVVRYTCIYKYVTLYSQLKRKARHHRTRYYDGNNLGGSGLTFRNGWAEAVVIDIDDSGNIESISSDQPYSVG